MERGISYFISGWMRCGFNGRGIPQPIDQDPIKQDIVKIEVSPEQPKYSMRFFSDDNASDNLAARNHLAVMVIDVGDIRIKVTNQINPQLLAETIRLLGGNA